MSNQYFTLSRLYVDQDFSVGEELVLSDVQTHYLKTVMRRQPGDEFRVFNGRDGEFLAKIQEFRKKATHANLEKQIAEQPDEDRKVHLIFAPLKKNRMDILIEKAVELGVTDLHPVVTNRSDVRKINEKRIAAQVMEAAEQCERFSIPAVHDLENLDTKLRSWPTDVQIYTALERGEDTHINDAQIETQSAFIIGPTGGFDDDEVQAFLQNTAIKPISLGKTVYRAETAAIICLVHAQNS